MAWQVTTKKRRNVEKKHQVSHCIPEVSRYSAQCYSKNYAKEVSLLSVTVEVLRVRLTKKSQITQICTKKLEQKVISDNRVIIK